MVRIRLKYVVEDVDRHGNVRRYLRLPGQPKVRLRGAPGTKEFMDQYDAALAGRADRPRQAREAACGSFRRLCISYYGSAAFTRLDPSTQAWQRRALDRISERHADKPVAMMQQKHVRKLRDELRDKPGASKNRLKALRALFRWAVEADEAPHDPTIGVKAISYATKGFHAWTIEEVEAYEQRHPIGTKARLALAILLYTSWRREDAVRLGPQHVRDARIKYRQAKNEHRNPVDMNIPLHPDLAEAIAALPPGHLTFLVTEFDKPYTPKGFGNAFKDWCRQANLPHCSGHGLRKAAAVRLAERGATPHEIMAITGHRTLEEVERYTRAVRQAQLADSAMAKLKRRTLSVPPFVRWDDFRQKRIVYQRPLLLMALPRGLEPLFSP
jgi:integrase/recombinase XerD